ncbi:unnamed protein product, partial [Polarella glacialis]
MGNSVFRSWASRLVQKHGGAFVKEIPQEVLAFSFTGWSLSLERLELNERLLEDGLKLLLPFQVDEAWLEGVVLSLQRGGVVLVQAERVVIRGSVRRQADWLREGQSETFVRKTATEKEKLLTVHERGVLTWLLEALGGDRSGLPPPTPIGPTQGVAEANALAAAAQYAPDLELRLGHVELRLEDREALKEAPFAIVVQAQKLHLGPDCNLRLAHLLDPWNDAWRLDLRLQDAQIFCLDLPVVTAHSAEEQRGQSDRGRACHNEEQGRAAPNTEAGKAAGNHKGDQMPVIGPCEELQLDFVFCKRTGVKSAAQRPELRCLPMSAPRGLRAPLGSPGARGGDGLLVDEGLGQRDEGLDAWEEVVDEDAELPMLCLAVRGTSCLLRPSVQQLRQITAHGVVIWGRWDLLQKALDDVRAPVLRFGAKGNSRRQEEALRHTYRQLWMQRLPKLAAASLRSTGQGKKSRLGLLKFACAAAQTAAVQPGKSEAEPVPPVLADAAEAVVSWDLEAAAELTDRVYEVAPQLEDKDDEEGDDQSEVGLSEDPQLVEFERDHSVHDILRERRLALLENRDDNEVVENMFGRSASEGLFWSLPWQSSLKPSGALPLPGFRDPEPRSVFTLDVDLVASPVELWAATTDRASTCRVLRVSSRESCPGVAGDCNFGVRVLLGVHAEHPDLAPVELQVLLRDCRLDLLPAHCAPAQETASDQPLREQQLSAQLRLQPPLLSVSGSLYVAMDLVDHLDGAIRPRLLPKRVHVAAGGHLAGVLEPVALLGTVAMIDGLQVLAKIAEDEEEMFARAVGEGFLDKFDVLSECSDQLSEEAIGTLAEILGTLDERENEDGVASSALSFEAGAYEEGPGQEEALPEGPGHGEALPEQRREEVLSEDGDSPLDIPRLIQVVARTRASWPCPEPALGADLRIRADRTPVTLLLPCHARPGVPERRSALPTPGGQMDGSGLLALQLRLSCGPRVQEKPAGSARSDTDKDHMVAIVMNICGLLAWALPAVGWQKLLSALDVDGGQAPLATQQPLLRCDQLCFDLDSGAAALRVAPLLLHLGDEDAKLIGQFARALELAAKEGKGPAPPAKHTSSDAHDEVLAVPPQLDLGPNYALSVRVDLAGISVRLAQSLQVSSARKNLKKNRVSFDSPAAAQAVPSARAAGSVEVAVLQIGRQQLCVDLDLRQLGTGVPLQLLAAAEYRLNQASFTDASGERQLLRLSTNAGPRSFEESAVALHVTRGAEASAIAVKLNLGSLAVSTDWKLLTDLSHCVAVLQKAAVDCQPDGGTPGSTSSKPPLDSRASPIPSPATAASDDKVSPVAMLRDCGIGNVQLNLAKLKLLVPAGKLGGFQLQCGVHVSGGRLATTACQEEDNAASGPAALKLRAVVSQLGIVATSATSLASGQKRWVRPVLHPMRVQVKMMLQGAGSVAAATPAPGPAVRKSTVKVKVLQDEVAIKVALGPICVTFQPSQISLGSVLQESVVQLVEHLEREFSPTGSLPPRVKSGALDGVGEGSASQPIALSKLAPWKARAEVTIPVLRLGMVPNTAGEVGILLLEDLSVRAALTSVTRVSSSSDGEPENRGILPFQLEMAGRIGGLHVDLIASDSAKAKEEQLLPLIEPLRLTVCVPRGQAPRLSCSITWINAHASVAAAAVAANAYNSFLDALNSSTSTSTALIPRPGHVRESTAGMGTNRSASSVACVSKEVDFLGESRRIGIRPMRLQNRLGLPVECVALGLGRESVSKLAAGAALPLNPEPDPGADATLSPSQTAAEKRPKARHLTVMGDFRSSSSSHSSGSGSKGGAFDSLVSAGSIVASAGSSARAAGNIVASAGSSARAAASIVASAGSSANSMLRGLKSSAAGGSFASSNAEKGNASAARQSLSVGASTALCVSVSLLPGWPSAELHPFSPAVAPSVLALPVLSHGSAHAQSPEHSQRASEGSSSRQARSPPHGRVFHMRSVATAAAGAAADVAIAAASAAMGSAKLLGFTPAGGAFRRRRTAGDQAERDLLPVLVRKVVGADEEHELHLSSLIYLENRSSRPLLILPLAEPHAGGQDRKSKDSSPSRDPGAPPEAPSLIPGSGWLLLEPGCEPQPLPLLWCVPERLAACVRNGTPAMTAATAAGGHDARACDVTPRLWCVPASGLQGAKEGFWSRPASGSSLGSLSQEPSQEAQEAKIRDLVQTGGHLQPLVGWESWRSMLLAAGEEEEGFEDDSHDMLGLRLEGQLKGLCSTAYGLGTSRLRSAHQALFFVLAVEPLVQICNRLCCDLRLFSETFASGGDNSDRVLSEKQSGQELNEVVLRPGEDMTLDYATTLEMELLYPDSTHPAAQMTSELGSTFETLPEIAIATHPLALETPMELDVPDNLAPKDKLRKLRFVGEGGEVIEVLASWQPGLRLDALPCWNGFHVRRCATLAKHLKFYVSHWLVNRCGDCELLVPSPGSSIGDAPLLRVPHHALRPISQHALQEDVLRLGLRYDAPTGDPKQPSDLQELLARRTAFANFRTGTMTSAGMNMKSIAASNATGRQAAATEASILVNRPCSGMVSLSRRPRGAKSCFGYTVRTAPWPFYQTLMVELTRRYTLVNHKKHALWVCEDVPGAMPVQLEPGETRAYHPQGQDSLLLRINGAGGPEGYSAAFSLTSMMDGIGGAPQHGSAARAANAVAGAVDAIGDGRRARLQLLHGVDLRQGGSAMLVVPEPLCFGAGAEKSTRHAIQEGGDSRHWALTAAEARVDSGAVVLRFSEPLRPAFRIVNRTTKTLAFRQDCEAAPDFKLPPEQSMPFAWFSPEEAAASSTSRSHNGRAGRGPWLLLGELTAETEREQSKNNILLEGSHSKNNILSEGSQEVEEDKSRIFREFQRFEIGRVQTHAHMPVGKGRKDRRRGPRDTDGSSRETETETYRVSTLVRQGSLEVHVCPWARLTNATTAAVAVYARGVRGEKARAAPGHLQGAAASSQLAARELEQGGSIELQPPAPISADPCEWLLQLRQGHLGHWSQPLRLGLASIGQPIFFPAASNPGEERPAWGGGQDTTEVSVARDELSDFLSIKMSVCQEQPFLLQNMSSRPCAISPHGASGWAYTLKPNSNAIPFFSHLWEGNTTVVLAYVDATSSEGGVTGGRFTTSFDLGNAQVLRSGSISVHVGQQIDNPRLIVLRDATQEEEVITRTILRRVRKAPQFNRKPLPLLSEKVPGFGEETGQLRLSTAAIQKIASVKRLTFAAVGSHDRPRKLERVPSGNSTINSFDLASPHPHVTKRTHTGSTVGTLQGNGNGVTWSFSQWRLISGRILRDPSNCKNGQCIPYCCPQARKAKQRRKAMTMRSSKYDSHRAVERALARAAAGINGVATPKRQLLWSVELLMEGAGLAMLDSGASFEVAYGCIRGLSAEAAQHTSEAAETGPLELKLRVAAVCLDVREDGSNANCQRHHAVLRSWAGALQVTPGAAFGSSSVLRLHSQLQLVGEEEAGSGGGQQGLLPSGRSGPPGGGRSSRAAKLAHCDVQKLRLIVQPLDLRIDTTVVCELADWALSLAEKFESLTKAADSNQPQTSSRRSSAGSVLDVLEGCPDDPLLGEPRCVREPRAEDFKGQTPLFIRQLELRKICCVISMNFSGSGADQEHLERNEQLSAMHHLVRLCLPLDVHQ